MKYTLSINKQKPHDHLNKCRKSIWRTPIPFQNKNTQQDATRREFNNQKGIQRPESTYGKPTAKQRAQHSDRCSPKEEGRSDQCSPRDKRRDGQTDAPPETRWGTVRPMLPQRQDEGWSDRCSPRDKRRVREGLLFKAMLDVLARVIKQGKTN